MGEARTHLIFIAVALAVAAFLLAMRRRLRARYPDDDSRQMRSMLAFMRGMAAFAGVVAVVVAADLARRWLV